MGSVIIARALSYLIACSIGMAGAVSGVVLFGEVARVEEPAATAPAPVLESRAMPPPGLQRGASCGSAKPARDDEEPYAIDRDSEGVLRATNVAHALLATFGTEGVEVRSPDGASMFSFTGTGYGCPEDVRTLPATRPVLAMDRVEYRRGDVVETYKNDPNGLEQSFVLSRPPECRTTQGPGVVVEFSVSGGAAIDIPRNKSEPAIAAVLHDPSGRLARTYAGLHVVDALGTSVPAWLSSRGKTMVIEIDDAHATYPILVDPTLSNLLPCSIVASEDTTIATDPTDPTQANSNFGTATQIGTGLYGTTTKNSLLKFDLSQIPASVTIDSARLVLGKVSSAGGTSVDFEVYRVVSAWTGSTVTWSSFGFSIGASPEVTLSGPWTSVGRTSLDITSLATGWYDQSITNAGVLTKMSATSGRLSFGSAEAAAAFRPRLDVAYHYASCSGQADGVPCSDGDPCTSGDYCENNGCHAGYDMMHCEGACQECNAATGKCDGDDKDPGASCDDGDACTTGEACDGSGTCASNAVGATQCDGGAALASACHTLATGACQPSTGPAGKALQGCNYEYNGASSCLECTKKEMWFQLTVRDAVDLNLHEIDAAGMSAAKAIIDTAAASGYEGMFLDLKGGLDKDVWEDCDAIDPYIEALAELIVYARGKPMKAVPLILSMGHSKGWLRNYPHLAEGEKVLGTLFTVDCTSATPKLDHQPEVVGLPLNSTFDTQTTAGICSNWTTQGPKCPPGNPCASANDACLLDSKNNLRCQAKCQSGTVTIDANHLASQTIPLIPWRQYHVYASIKRGAGSGSEKYPQIDVSDAVTMASLYVTDRNLKMCPSSVAALGNCGTFDWATQTGSFATVDFTFNSRDSSAVTIALSSSSTSASDQFIFESVDLEETSLVNAIDRVGAPIRVYEPNCNGQEFAKGTDYTVTAPSTQTFQPWADASDPSSAFYDETYHIVPNCSTFTEGQVVRMNYYAVQPVRDEVSVCLTDSRAHLDEMIDFIVKTKTRCSGVTNVGNSLFDFSDGLLLNYDEIVHAHTCGSCTGVDAGLPTAGDLLARSLEQTVDSLHASQSDAGLPTTSQLYVWSSMFDPFHNGRAGYGLAATTFAQSWEALDPAEFVLLNWAYGGKCQNPNGCAAGVDEARATASLNFFSSRNIHQIIAGYYDSSHCAPVDGGCEAIKEVALTNVGSPHVGIPYVKGLGYFTWPPYDYSELAAYIGGADPDAGFPGCP